MKKVLAILAAMVMAVALTACGPAEDDGKISQPHCDAGDPKCVELPRD